MGGMGALPSLRACRTGSLEMTWHATQPQPVYGINWNPDQKKTELAVHAGSVYCNGVFYNKIISFLLAS